MKTLLIALCVNLLASYAAQAHEYVLDKTQSALTFNGTHAGSSFNGKFENWDAAIRFDPVHLITSKVEVTIDTASAKTGNIMYDGTLPSADWFDAKTHPNAVFVSESIVKNTDGSYTANGTLTIRGIAKPVSFSFTLGDLSTSPVKASFTLELDRIAYSIGEKSDAKAEWVGRTITLGVTVVASRK